MKEIMKESPENLEAKFSHDVQKLSTNTVEDWIKAWIADIIRANNRTPSTRMISVGIGKTTRLFRMRNDFRAIDEFSKNLISKAYVKAKNRLIILDNEGTLIPPDPFKGSEFANTFTELSEPVQFLLKNICSDPSNTVAIVSQRDTAHMSAKFSDIENLWIAAENGYFYGYNGPGQLMEFNKLVEIKDWGWKATVQEIVNSYQERTDGSFVTIKDSDVRWFFRDVDTDFGIKESNELVAHLHTILENLPLEIIHGKDYVQVRPAGVDKGAFCKQLMQSTIRRKGPIDFVLCFGDSEADESMYKNLKECAKTPILQQNTFCITVGQKDSLADYYVNDYSEVVTTLAEIVRPVIEVFFK